MKRNLSWVVLSLMGWMLLLGCSAETAAPTALPPTAMPPTDVPTAISPTESPPTAIPATETAVPATEAPAVAAATEAPAAAEPEGITHNGYANVLYTQDDFDSLTTGERIKLVNVYANW